MRLGLRPPARAAAALQQQARQSVCRHAAEATGNQTAEDVAPAFDSLEKDFLTNDNGYLIWRRLLVLLAPSNCKENSAVALLVLLQQQAHRTDKLSQQKKTDILKEKIFVGETEQQTALSLRWKQATSSSSSKLASALATVERRNHTRNPKASSCLTSAPHSQRQLRKDSTTPPNAAGEAAAAAVVISALPHCYATLSTKSDLGANPIYTPYFTNFP